MLIVAAIVTASLDHWVDTWVILAVVIANAIMGFIQEGRAEESMAAIWQMLAPHASVLRAHARHGRGPDDAAGPAGGPLCVLTVVGVCQRCCPPISCGVSDCRDADFGFWVEPDGSGGLPVAGFA